MNNITSLSQAGNWGLDWWTPLLLFPSFLLHVPLGDCLLEQLRTENFAKRFPSLGVQFADWRRRYGTGGVSRDLWKQKQLSLVPLKRRAMSGSKEWHRIKFLSQKLDLTQPLVSFSGETTPLTPSDRSLPSWSSPLPTLLLWWTNVFCVITSVSGKHFLFNVYLLIDIIYIMIHIYIHTHILFSDSFPHQLVQNIEYSFICYTVDLAVYLFYKQ